MIIFKCDGKQFINGLECHRDHQHSLPDNWITIKGRIINGNRDAHVIESNKELHFCSRGCLIDYFFKNEQQK